MFIIRTVICDLAAVFLRSPQFLIFSVAVVFDNRVGRRQNIGCGSVVLLQFYNLCIFEIFFKFEDISDICASPLINALVISIGTCLKIVLMVR